jgi:hypothetical protein
VSNSDSSSQRAIDDLERVLGAVADELASWRRRALRAEAGSSDQETVPEPVLDRLASLESENSDLKDRVAAAREKADGLMSRLHFFEQQVGE